MQINCSLVVSSCFQAIGLAGWQSGGWKKSSKKYVPNAFEKLMIHHK